MVKGANDKSRQIYLLHCWQERPAILTEKAIWRFSVEKIGAPQSSPRGFAGREALVAFLQAELMGRVANQTTSG